MPFLKTSFESLAPMLAAQNIRIVGLGVVGEPGG